MEHTEDYAPAQVASQTERVRSNEQARSKSKASKKRPLAQGALVLLVCATTGFAGGYVGASGRSNLDTGSTTINAADQQQARSESQLISAIARKASPSVVSVNVTSQTRSSLGSYQQESAGTGIILSEDGYIVTNRHVVPAGTSTVSVTLSDGTQLEKVSVVGRTGTSDPLDIAFLKVTDTEGVKLTPASIGDSSKVEIGDKVVAIGNALGQFQNTVTDGIISGYGRDIQAGSESGGDVETLQNLFQTNAAINQGNSGGPLLNIDGEVIGINTAVAGEGAQNIGFSIPINDVKGLIDSVLKQGKIVRPYLGVRYVTLTDDYAYEHNLSVKRGAYLAPVDGGSAIISGSPADKAGLREKDIITKVNGTEIDDRNSLTSLVGQKSVGDEVKLTVVRDGKEMIVTATLASAPSS